MSFDNWQFQFYFPGLRLFCGEKHFLQPVEMAMLVFWGVPEIIFGKSWIWGSAMCIYVQSVCSAITATSRRYDSLPRPLALKDTYTPIGCEEKKGVCPGNWERVSLWRQEAHLLRIALPVGGPLGMCYFCIYLFYFVFILFNFYYIHNCCFFFFNFLFNPHKCCYDWSNPGIGYTESVEVIGWILLTGRRRYGKRCAVTSEKEFV